MARVFSFVAALAVCLIATSSALTLDEIGEEFGNAPQAGLSPGQLAILNDAHRVYLYHVASDGYKSYIAGYFQGDTAAAQDALCKFAALDKGLDVVLLPGPREVTTIAKKQRVNADWELRIPERAGLRGHNPTLLVVKAKVKAKGVRLDFECGAGYAEQRGALQPGSHFFPARHDAIAAAPAGELNRSIRSSARKELESRHGTCLFFRRGAGCVPDCYLVGAGPRRDR
jgi:hypothetical protein